MVVLSGGSTVATTIAQANTIVGGTDDLFFLLPFDN